MENTAIIEIENFPKYRNKKSGALVRAVEVGAFVRRFGSDGDGVLEVIPKEKVYEKVELRGSGFAMAGNIGDYWLRIGLGSSVFMSSGQFKDNYEEA